MKRCNQKEVNLSKEFLSGIFLEIPNDFRSLQENGRVELVGGERIELLLCIEPPKIWITSINSNGYNNLRKLVLNHPT